MLSIEILESINRLLTASEIAELLFVSVKTVYQWVELNQIPYLKLNGSVRFHPRDIDIWIKNSKKGPWIDYNMDAQTVAGARKGGRN